MKTISRHSYSIDDFFCLFKVGDFCYRFSAHPLSFSEALATCKSENSELAFVQDKNAQAEISSYINLKKERFDYFNNVEDFWLGGQPTPGDGGSWEWLASSRSMQAYENWRAKIRGKKVQFNETNKQKPQVACFNSLGFGCPTSGCQTSIHSLRMRASALNDWVATEKSNPLPYICMSKCRRGFEWYQSLNKCLKVSTQLK